MSTVGSEWRRTEKKEGPRCACQRVCLHTWFFLPALSPVFSSALPCMSPRVRTCHKLSCFYQRVETIRNVETEKETVGGEKKVLTKQPKSTLNCQSRNGKKEQVHSLHLYITESTSTYFGRVIFAGFYWIFHRYSLQVLRQNTSSTIMLMFIETQCMTGLSKNTTVSVHHWVYIKMLKQNV